MAEGIDDYMVEIGGELRIQGTHPDGKPWRIAIEQPDASQRLASQIITPGTMGIATSGDYRNYFEREGIRYSHTIDPKTGRPIQNHVVSVTVLHPSSMVADGLATGFSVMGAEQALAIAEREHIAVLMMVYETGESVRLISSSHYRALTEQPPGVQP